MTTHPTKHHSTAKDDPSGGAAKVDPTPNQPARRRRTVHPAGTPRSLEDVLAGLESRDAIVGATPKRHPRRQTTRPTNRRATPKVEPSGGSTSDAAKQVATPNDGSRRQTATRPTKLDATPKGEPPGGSDSGAANLVAETKARPRRRPTSRPTKMVATANSDPSDGTTTPRQTRTRPIPMVRTSVGGKLAGRQGTSDTQNPPAAGLDQGPVVSARTTSMENSLLDPTLALAADVLDDIERVRIANENRLRQLTRSVDDVDGEMRGFGLTEDHPAVARLAAIVNTLVQVEKDATKALEKSLQAHPLHPWIKAQHGVGDKQAARLLAAIGDPYIRPELHYEDGTTKPEGPRTVSALWAYSGYHTVPVAAGQASSSTQTAPADQALRDPQRATVGGSSYPDQGPHNDQTGFVWVAARRARGQRANWSATAKMRAHLVAEKVVQLSHPVYREVYSQRRVVTETRLHAVDCVRCGPSGKPAKAGTPWSKGHQHADGLRIVAKEILKDLWREARRIHTGIHPEAAGGDHGRSDSQPAVAAAGPNRHTETVGHRVTAAQNLRAAADLGVLSSFADYNEFDAQAVDVGEDRAALDYVPVDTQDPHVEGSP